jgi:hypothetical protein
VVEETETPAGDEVEVTVEETEALTWAEDVNAPEDTPLDAPEEAPGFEG